MSGINQQMPMLGETGLILEGVVTTQNADGSTNISPMGPIVDQTMTRLHFRPYQTSTTYQNLRRTGQGILHVTDDADLIARAAVGALEEQPALHQANRVEGKILTDACRWYAFETLEIDHRQARTNVFARVIDRGVLREFFGFNRAKHALLELAILATRVQFLPAETIAAELERLTAPIEKTAGPEELRTFEFLKQFFAANLKDQDVRNA